jgi:Zn-dependent protease
MSDVAPAARACAGCGTELAPALLACPACHALVHRERLDALARDADTAGKAGDFATAARLWRDALALLPSGSRQSAAVAARVDAAATAAQKADLAALRRGDGTRLAKIVGPLLVAGVFLLSKAKLLLLGLTKLGTLLSMFVFLGLYWAAWGWKFALAVVVGIYIHEMGHVAALRRRGMRADAPLFVPGLGAFVRMREHATTPSEDARIGLAGPWWGLGASLAALLAWRLTGIRFWGAVAHTTAWINLFNLMPVWQLDGSRGFSAISRVQRVAAAALIAVAFAVTREKMLVMIALVALYRAFQKQQPERGEWRAFGEYALLLAAFSGMMLIKA